MRRLLRDVIESDPSFEVVGVATNGREAILLNKTFQPDCMTLDVEMPVMNGLEALKEIMKTRPVPIIMVSSVTTDGQHATIEALLEGAVDYVAKPSGALSLDLDIIKDQLLTKLRTATLARLEHPTDRSSTLHFSDSVKNTLLIDRESKIYEKIVVIGASTGGPKALERVLSDLPDDLPAPVLVVQHMPANFTKTLAQRLNNAAKLKVKEAENGEYLKNGTVYVAPGGWQMQIKKAGEGLVVKLEDSEPIKGLKPCFDVLLDSLMPLNFSIVYTILTGMGSDGRNGLIALKKDHDVFAIAESEETATIFGMPKAAIQTGLIDQISALQVISREIVSQFH